MVRSYHSKRGPAPWSIAPNSRFCDLYGCANYRLLSTYCVFPSLLFYFIFVWLFSIYSIFYKSRVERSVRVKIAILRANRTCKATSFYWWGAIERWLSLCTNDSTSVTLFSIVSIGSGQCVNADTRVSFAIFSTNSIVVVTISLNVTKHELQSVLVMK